MQTIAQIETVADRAMNNELNAYLDRRYPADAQITEPMDDTPGRLKECATRCKAWISDLEIAAENGSTDKAWAALEELGCEVDQMLEEMP